MPMSGRPKAVSEIIYIVSILNHSNAAKIRFTNYCAKRLLRSMNEVMMKSPDIAAPVCIVFFWVGLDNVDACITPAGG